jgi:1,4-dihydroxy-2-naphthoate octaprenyltransferase
MTLAVRFGRERTRRFCLGLIGLAFLALPVTLAAADGPACALIGLLAAPLAFKPAQAVLTSQDGPSLNAALAGTGALLGVFSLLVSVGLLIAA